MRFNSLSLTDSYKVSQWIQIPRGTRKMFGYLESRGGYFSEVGVFGNKYPLYNYISKGFTLDDVRKFERRCYLHFRSDKVFNKLGFMDMLKRYNGAWPIEIKSAPEGTSYPVLNSLLDAQNTDYDFPWVVDYLESLMVMQWYPYSVFTLSREIKKVIYKYLAETGDPTGIHYKLHDFGFRGASSVESAAIGGSAHMANFYGTDNMVALDLIEEVYGMENAGYSIPASQHSTITSWGKEHEVDAMRNILKQFWTEPIVACVCDSYDVENAARKIWGELMHGDIMEHKGTFVFRPDSGDAVYWSLKIIEILAEKFGFTVNKKGYKVLDPHVRIIWGDGINYESIKAILEHLKKNGWSADNIAFGMGGALLQRIDRDTQRFAFKCSSAEGVNEDGTLWSRDVFKDPVTDSGKRSKAGKLKLVKVDGLHGFNYKTVREEASNEQNILRPIFRNGKILITETFEEIRKRAEE